MSFRSPSGRSGGSGSQSPRTKISPRPSLVVLSRDDVVTPFMKRRYDPKNVKAPVHSFDRKKKANDAKKEDENEGDSPWGPNGELINRGIGSGKSPAITAEEERLRREEEERLRREEEERLRREEEERLRKEEEERLRREEEERLRKEEEEERLRREEEERLRREEEERLRREEEERLRKEEEERLRREEEERLRREEEERLRREEEERLRREEERLRREEEERLRKEEEERLRKEEERLRKEEEERLRREEEERLRREEEERLRREEEERLRKEEEERLRKEEEERLRREEEERLRREEEERLRREEEERLRREEEERLRKQEEERLKAEEARRRKEERQRKREELERLRREEEQRKREELAERRRKQEEEDRIRRQEEAERRKIEAERKKKDHEELRRKREEDLKRIEDEFKRQREEAKKRKEDEEEKQKKDAAKRLRQAIERQKKKKEEAERRRAEEEELERQEEEERLRRIEEIRRQREARFARGDSILSPRRADDTEEETSSETLEEEEPYENPFFGDLDAMSYATSNFSVFIDDETFNDKVRKQLDFDALGSMFPGMFDSMKPEFRRRLGRIARLQAVQKRKWLSAVWSLFDPNFSQEGLWMTLNAMMNDDGTTLNGLLASARDVAKRFLRYTSFGPVLHVRAIVTGPRFAGKTTFMRSIFLHLLNILVDTGIFKTIFIVSLDARGRSEELSTREGIYYWISEAVVKALLAQRPDLQLFAHSLEKAFGQLLTAPKAKKLPKPISSQDYLRRPMKIIDALLSGLFDIYHDEKAKKKIFLNEILSLPRTIADIFGFANCVVVFDHVDSVNVQVDDLPLIEFVKRGLLKCQFLISGMDCDELDKLLTKSVDFGAKCTKVSVSDVCVSQNESRVIEVVFRNESIVPMSIDSGACGGCPTFVSRFDDICRVLDDYSEETDATKKQELMIIASTKMEVLLDLVMSFGRYEEKDGGPPKVKELLLKTKEEVL